MLTLREYKRKAAAKTLTELEESVHEQVSSIKEEGRAGLAKWFAIGRFATANGWWPIARSRIR